MSDIRVGDQVRVTFEAKVVPGEAVGCLCTNGKISEKYLAQPGITSVEKVEPPVEVFGPGDVLRHKGGDNEYLLTTDGFVRLKGYGWTGEPNFKHVEMDRVVLGQEFTSKSYEKVNLSELPF